MFLKLMGNSLCVRFFWRNHSFWSMPQLKLFPPWERYRLFNIEVLLVSYISGLYLSVNVYLTIPRGKHNHLCNDKLPHAWSPLWCGCIVSCSGEIIFCLHMKIYTTVPDCRVLPLHTNILTKKLNQNMLMNWIFYCTHFFQSKGNSCIHNVYNSSVLVLFSALLHTEVVKILH